MVRYLGPKLRIVRRLGSLVGFTTKMPKMRFKTPGEHGQIIFSKENRSSLKDDYKERLLEKQKVRFNYGITEGQLIKYCKLAKKSRSFSGSKLLELLEARLDCIVYRLGFAPSISSARQIVNHGHILVNGHRVNIPSFSCQKGDIILAADKQVSLKLIETRLLAKFEANDALERRAKQINATNEYFQPLLPDHLELSPTYAGRVLSTVSSQDVLAQVNALKVIEYYSK